jgi:hypothetical protein
MCRWPKCYPHPQLIFPSKTWFFGIYLICWSILLKIFPTTPKAHSNSSEIFSYDLIEFSVKKSFNIQDLLHRKSKHHETKLMHPSSLRAFQRDQEHDMKHHCSVDLISTNKTKQTNNLPS